MKNVLNKILKTVSSTTEEIPKIRYHVANDVVNFHENYVCSVIAFDGVVFEAISDNVLENDYDALNRIYAETAKEKAGRLAFTTHLHRREIQIDTEYEFKNDFCQNFAKKYLSRFNDNKYYENKFYITLLMKFDSSIDEAIQEIHTVIDTFTTTLKKYEPKVLTSYKNDQDVLKSEVYDFFSELINSEKPIVPTPITGSPAYEVLPSAELHFGFDLLQIRGEQQDKYATLYDLKDFPQSCHLGMFNSASLSLPFEYNLMQSFTALSPAKSISRIQSQANKLLSTGDKAEHQQQELIEAQGYIQTGEIGFGEYHCALIVYGDTQKQAVDNGTYATASFSNNAGAVFRRSKLSAPATYFSQLPNSKTKPRPMLKSSRNLASTFSMHNYSKGKGKGNPLGDGSAVIPLETASKTMYDFNFHFTNPLEDNVGDSIAGHTLLLGATGTGKTTLQTALITFVNRFDPAMFILDKDRGMDIFVRALDGDYFAIEEGVPTGINPFQFKDTPELRGFLNDLVITCATDKNSSCSSEEQNQIKYAIDTVMQLPMEHRRFSNLLQSIPDRGGNELYQRLMKWCTTEENHGRFAWCLDNPANHFDPDTFKIVGFEVGSILKEDYQPTEPLLACLLYMKSQMVKNYELILSVVEECWLPLLYPTPQKMILDTLKTGRKMGEFLLLITQSPEELIKSPIFPALVQQTPTKILLPNPDAEYKNDQGGGYSRIGLTEKEFNQLKKLSLDSRTFLIKQGHNSSFGVLNLYGFNDEISVLSSTKSNVQLLDQLLELLPIHMESKEWLPMFYDAQKMRKNGNLDLVKLVKQYEVEV